MKLAAVLAILAAGVIHASPAQAAVGSYPCKVSAATGATGTYTLATHAVAGDGKNDAAAINADIATVASHGGGKVVLAAGVYNVAASILDKSGVALVGQGQGVTTIRAMAGLLSYPGPGGGHPVFSTNGASNTTLRGVTVDGNSVNLNWNVSGRLSAYTVEARNSTNALIQSVSVVNPGTYSIALVSSTRVCVRYSHTTAPSTSGKYDQLDGIHDLQSTYFDIVDDTVRQNNGSDGDDGIAVHTISAGSSHGYIAGNDVSGGRHGSDFQWAFSCCTISAVTVTDNSFHDGPGGMHTGYYGGSGNLTGVTITQNRFTNNGGGISLSNTTQSTITGNTLTCSGGVSVTGSGNTVTGNTVTCP